MQHSRLPVSTSVRRPTSIAKGSTSFMGLNRPSAIPSTLRKYSNELFTPQTKTPLRAPYGASTAGKSYRGIGVATEKKYKKPPPEREELQQMFDNLVEYLRANANPNVPLPEAKKFFSSVSTTESTRIFQLLIGRIRPDFKITRLETDVPEALASLDYPYIRSVTKSSLVSVTSRTAATALLVIFDWLIKQIYTLEKLEPFDGSESITDDWDEVCKIKLLQPEVGREAFQEPFERLHPMEDAQQLVCEHEKLADEDARLACELEEIQEDLNEKQTLEEDVMKCSDYKVNMEKYCECKLKELEETKNQIRRVTIQKEELVKTSQRGQLDINNHELDVDEVMRDHAAVQGLESERANLRNQISEAITEYDHWRVKNQGQLRDRIQDNIKEKVNQLRALLEECESQSYADSSTLGERKLELAEWITRMKQIPPNDLAQVQRVFHDLSLYMQKLQATDSRLETEILDQLTREKSALDELMAANAIAERETVPRLQEALKRKEHEKKVEEMQFMDADAKNEAQREEKRRQLIARKENIDKEMLQLEHQWHQEAKRLETDTRDIAQMRELDEQHLRVVIDSHKQEEINLMKEMELTTRRWQEARTIAEANSRLVREAQKVKKLLSKLSRQQAKG